MTVPGSDTGPRATRRPRDTGRAAFYHAENLVLGMFDRASDFRAVHLAGSTVTLPVERRFASVESVQDYVDAVLALPWVRETWPQATTPVTVRRRTGSAKAHYHRAGAVIALPGHVANHAWALRELVVLHELAHHLTDPAEADHGAAFAGTLVELVSDVIGAEAGFALRVTLLDAGVAVG